jgi:hypothetical protein
MGPPLFDFYGLGQQVLAPIAAHDPQPAPNLGLLANDQNLEEDLQGQQNFQGEGDQGDGQGQ